MQRVENPVVRHFIMRALSSRYTVNLYTFESGLAFPLPFEIKMCSFILFAVPRTVNPRSSLTHNKPEALCQFRNESSCDSLDRPPQCPLRNSELWCTAVFHRSTRIRWHTSDTGTRLRSNSNRVRAPDILHNVRVIDNDRVRYTSNIARR